MTTSDANGRTDEGGLAPGEQIKVRMLFAGGVFVAGLGIFALATGQLGRGSAYLVIGLVAIVLGVKMARSVTEGDEAAAYTVWYTAALGLAIMGGGAAVTIPARDAETTGGQMVLFLAAGVLLWMGVTCVIAAVLKARKAAAG
ncbi:MAG: hypothetical protein ACRD0C_05265 [Acidimicrobiia bacterium]